MKFPLSRLYLILFSSLICVTFVGCNVARITLNNPITQEDVAFIVPGQTTLTDVIMKLGRPRFHNRFAYRRCRNISLPRREVFPCQFRLVTETLVAHRSGSDHFTYWPWYRCLRNYSVIPIGLSHTKAFSAISLALASIPIPFDSLPFAASHRIAAVHWPRYNASMETDPSDHTMHPHTNIISPSYIPADRDLDFLQREELRSIRIGLQELEPDANRTEFFSLEKLQVAIGWDIRGGYDVSVRVHRVIGWISLHGRIIAGPVKCSNSMRAVKSSESKRIGIEARTGEMAEKALMGDNPIRVTE